MKTLILMIATALTLSGCTFSVFSVKGREITRQPLPHCDFFNVGSRYTYQKADGTVLLVECIIED